MVIGFFQMQYDLNIWIVLITGVLGSALGRYILSKYVPFLSDRYINLEKNEDLHYLGKMLSGNSWRIQLFVLIYTLMPLPSTALFTAAGVARVRAIHVIPTFLVGKFISDMVMVFTGDYVANNTASLVHGLLTWKSISGIAVGLIMLCLLLFIDWRKLLIEKKISLNFHIFK